VDFYHVYLGDDIMIYMLTGRIRDGKSYHAMAQWILPALKKGRKVITNLDFGAGTGPDRKEILKKRFLRITALVNEGKGMEARKKQKPIEDLLTVFENTEQVRSTIKLPCLDDDYNCLDPKFRPGIPDVRGALIVIDEAQLIWSSKGYTKVDPQFQAFLSLHGHFGADMVFIVQNRFHLDKAICAIVNEGYYIRNMRFQSILAKNTYRCTTYADLEFKEPFATDYYTFDKRVFACYKSEDRAQQYRAPLIPQYLRNAAAAVMICLTVLSVTWSRSFYNTSSKAWRPPRDAVREIPIRTNKLGGSGAMLAPATGPELDEAARLQNLWNKFSELDKQFQIKMTTFTTIDVEKECRAWFPSGECAAHVGDPVKIYSNSNYMK